MIEKDVTFFSTLLDIQAEDVEQAITDGTLSDKITALELLNKQQVETLKTNLRDQAKSEYLDELSEQAKKGELPQSLYKPVHGAVSEMLEKNLSKKYEVDEFENVYDLVEKAIQTNAAKSDDTKLIELQEKYKSLQGVNENLVKEKDEATITARDEYMSKLLLRDKNDEINNVPFDFSDVDEDKLETVSTQRRKVLNDVFDARYKLTINGDDKMVILDKEDKPLLDPATFEPRAISDVLTELANDLSMRLKSPDTGGRGDKSSGDKGSLKFRDYDAFEAYCHEHKILPTSAQGVDLWAKGKPQ